MIPGLEIHSEWISMAEEAELVAAIGSDMPDKPARCGRSRIERYGPGVVASGYRDAHAIEMDIPAWLAPVCSRAGDLAGFMPNAVTIACYQPGDGVLPHVDRKECGDVVAVVSLLGEAVMRFLPWSLDESRALSAIIRPRSLLVMRGEARWEWLHEISPVPGPRIALVLRHAAL